jgi:hypothetical protein
MNPIISSEYFIDHRDIVDNYRGLTCWLLYSDLHPAVSKFVRESWGALDAMSGQRCLITLIDKPSSANDPYWKNSNLTPEFGYLKTSRPFDRNQHIQIADMLDIPYANMPTVAFFSSTTASETLQISLENWADEDQLAMAFAELFDAVKRTVDQYGFDDIPCGETERFIDRREDCHRRLEPRLNRKRLFRSVRKVATARNILGVARIAASLG